MVEKVEVMLSRAVDELPGSPGWAYEPKLDGFRCVLATSDFGDVRLTSRRGKSLGRYFPEVVAAGRLLPPQLVLDGELVVPAGGGVDFAALQRRLHPSVARAPSWPGHHRPRWWPSTSSPSATTTYGGVPITSAGRSSRRCSQLVYRLSV